MYRTFKDFLLTDMKIIDNMNERQNAWIGTSHIKMCQTSLIMKAKAEGIMTCLYAPAKVAKQNNKNCYYQALAKMSFTPGKSINWSNHFGKLFGLSTKAEYSQAPWLAVLPLKNKDISFLLKEIHANVF